MKTGKLWLSLILAVATATLIAGAGAADGKFGGLDEATFKKLMSDGQVVIVEHDRNGATKLVTGGAIVDATPLETSQVVADFAAYQNWMPQVNRIVVDERKGNIWQTDYFLDFEFSVISIGVNYTLRHTFDLPGRIEFTRIKGDIKRVEGSWTFRPIDGGARTAVFYSAISDLRSMSKVVSYFLKSQPIMELAIQSSTAILVVEALKKRVESLKKKGAIAAPPGWELIAPKTEGNDVIPAEGN